MNSSILSFLVCALSLTVAAVSHRYCPEFGVTFKPLIWPAVLLAFTLKARYAAVTAASLPFLSAAVNGMPTWTIAAELSLVSFGTALAVSFIRPIAFPARKAA